MRMNSETGERDSSLGDLFSEVPGRSNSVLPSSFFRFDGGCDIGSPGGEFTKGCFLLERKDLVNGRLLSNVKASFDHQFAICQLSKLMKSIKCHTIAPIERVHSEWSG